MTEIQHLLSGNRTLNLDHECHMRRAIALTTNTPELPFAAVIVHRESGDTVAVGWNRSMINPTWHGEIDALNALFRSGHQIAGSELARRNGAALAPRWGAAMLVYLLIPGGIILFVRPLLGENGSARQAFGWGALFGLVLYGVYDLTNFAVLEKWTLRMTLADMAWGCVLCGTISVVMRFVDRWLTK